MRVEVSRGESRRRMSSPSRSARRVCRRWRRRLEDAATRRRGGRGRREGRANGGPLPEREARPRRRVVLVGLGPADELDADALRTAASRGRRSRRARRRDARLAARRLPASHSEQARAVVDGLLLGSYDPGRWKTGAQVPTSRSSGSSSSAATRSSEREARARRDGRARRRTAPATSRTPARTSSRRSGSPTARPSLRPSTSI